jgi:hypothetical protein
VSFASSAPESVRCGIASENSKGGQLGLPNLELFILVLFGASHSPPLVRAPPFLKQEIKCAEAVLLPFSKRIQHADGIASWSGEATGITLRVQELYEVHSPRVTSSLLHHTSWSLGSCIVEMFVARDVLVYTPYHGDRYPKSMVRHGQDKQDQRARSRSPEQGRVDEPRPLYRNGFGNSGRITALSSRGLGGQQAFPVQHLHVLPLCCNPADFDLSALVLAAPASFVTLSSAVQVSCKRMDSTRLDVTPELFLSLCFETTTQPADVVRRRNAAASREAAILRRCLSTSSVCHPQHRFAH